MNYEEPFSNVQETSLLCYLCIKIQLKNMAERKKQESRLHPESRFHGRYDLKKLQESCPELSEYVFVNDFGSETVNFH